MIRLPTIRLPALPGLEVQKSLGVAAVSALRPPEAPPGPSRWADTAAAIGRMKDADADIERLPVRDDRAVHVEAVVIVNAPEPAAEPEPEPEPVEDPTRPWRTIGQMAGDCGVSERTVRRWLAEDRHIESEKVGGRRRVRRAMS